MDIGNRRGVLTQTMDLEDFMPLNAIRALNSIDASILDVRIDYRLGLKIYVFTSPVLPVLNEGQSATQIGISYDSFLQEVTVTGY
jgi:hypothetical protein